MKQLGPRLIASISNSHLQNRLSDVHIGNPLPPHNFWRWSRCLGVTCSYRSQVVLLITVMPAAQVFCWDTLKPRARDFLSVGVGWGEGGILGYWGQGREGPELPLVVGLEGCLTAVRAQIGLFCKLWQLGWR